jgi:hypothetical protein
MIEWNSRKYRCPMEMDSGFTERRSNLTLLRAAAHLNDSKRLSIAYYLAPVAIVIKDLNLQSDQREIKK